MWKIIHTVKKCKEYNKLMWKWCERLTKRYGIYINDVLLKQECEEIVFIEYTEALKRALLCVL